jgi:hypothetical protein
VKALGEKTKMNVNTILEIIFLDERQPRKMFRQMSTLDVIHVTTRTSLVQAGSNYRKSEHAGNVCNTKRVRGCRADFGGEGMYRRGENHDKRDARATQLQFPNLLLRSEAEIKDRSFNINEEMQE